MSKYNRTPGKREKNNNKGGQIAETLIDEYSSEFTDQEIKYNERGEEINNKTEMIKLDNSYFRRDVTGIATHGYHFEEAQI